MIPGHPCHLVYGVASAFFKKIIRYQQLHREFISFALIPGIEKHGFMPDKITVVFRMHDCMAKLMGHDKLHFVLFQVFIQKDALMLFQVHIAAGPAPDSSY